MRELDNVIRLGKLGVRFDYYMMDAFWFDPDGGYRTWRKPSWPSGPDLWIKKCQENGIKPGLWFSSNTLVKIQPCCVGIIGGIEFEYIGACIGKTLWSSRDGDASSLCFRHGNGVLLRGTLGASLGRALAA